MRASWLEAREESWARRAALAPLLPVSWLYGGGAALHRWLAAREILPRRRLPGHVISVGNLVVGGTGKTPLAAWLARELHRRGRKVALASRGYGRSGGEPVSVVSDGRFVRGRAETDGDEPMVLAALATGVPVLVGRDRGVVGLHAFSAFGTEVLILDDGFQHHRLHRDIDIVSFDGRLGLGNGHILPRGPLREPIRALRHADAIAVFDGPLSPQDASLVAKWAPTARRVAVRRRTNGLRALSGGSRESAELLRGESVGLLAGLANPASFRRSLESLGARIVAERRFPDHHAYAPHDLAGLEREARLWVTTEKDSVKILPTWVGGADVRVLTLSLEIDEPGALLDWLESRLR